MPEEVKAGAAAADGESKYDKLTTYERNIINKYLLKPSVFDKTVIDRGGSFEERVNFAENWLNKEPIDEIIGHILYHSHGCDPEIIHWARLRRNEGVAGNSEVNTPSSQAYSVKDKGILSPELSQAATK